MYKGIYIYIYIYSCESDLISLYLIGAPTDAYIHYILVFDHIGEHLCDHLYDHLNDHLYEHLCEHPCEYPLHAHLSEGNLRS